MIWVTVMNFSNKWHQFGESSTSCTTKVLNPQKKTLKKPSILLHLDYLRKSCFSLDLQGCNYTHLTPLKIKLKPLGGHGKYSPTTSQTTITSQMSPKNLIPHQTRRFHLKKATAKVSLQVCFKLQIYHLYIIQKTSTSTGLQTLFSTLFSRKTQP